MYVCFPCLTLATRINPEEEEDIVGAVNDNADGKTGPLKYIIPNYQLY